MNLQFTVPSKIIFEQSFKKGKFPEIRKKANIVPVHKKEDKNLVKNHRPISLLPIFSKIYERVIYNALFNYIKNNKLFTSPQSSFLSRDSSIAQLLSIIHEIQTADCNLDIAPFSSNEFLDIQETIECGFTLKRVRDMTRTYSQYKLLLITILLLM